MNLHTLLETDLTSLINFRSEKHKEEFLVEFSDMFFERLLEQAYELLDDEADQQLEALIDTNPSQQEVFAFLSEKTPEFSGLVGEVFLDQRQEAIEILTESNS